MKPQALADNMQSITDKSIADHVSQTGDTVQTTNDDTTVNTSEGITDQDSGDQISTPPKEKKIQKPRHKPMFAAEQVARMAEIQDKLKEYEAAAAAAQPVATSQSPAVEAAELVIRTETCSPEPAVKKRKLSDQKSPTEKLATKTIPSPTITPAALPTKLTTPSPKQKPSARRRSSIASKSSEPEDPYCPNKVKELMGKLNSLGAGMEKAVSGITARASKLIAGEDAEPLRGRLFEMEKEWKEANREQMQKMLQFMERNGVIALGGVQVPSASLDMPVQTSCKRVSSSTE